MSALRESEFVVRTAAKPWVCVGCDAAIARGERHLEYLGEAHAYQSGVRYCAPCAESVWGVDRVYFEEA